MNKINFNIMKIKMFITSYFPLYIILLALQIKKYPIVFNIDAIFVPATNTRNGFDSFYINIHNEHN